MKETNKTSDPPLSSSADKVVIITGGSKGIGAGCARVFTEAGWRTFICARGIETGEAVAQELSSRGPGTCHFERCNVAQPKDLRRLVDKAMETHGHLDCLINNAGWHPDHRPIDDFSIEEFESLLRLNLVSYFAACQYALPHLRKRQGSIINMSSLVGNIGQEWATTYAATKGAITSMTKALAIDEMRNGVRVNVVLPGVILTDASVKRPRDMQERISSWQWAHREGLPEEVGHACLFLASTGANFITGTEVIVSGGAELGYGIKQPEPSLTGSASAKL